MIRTFSLRDFKGHRDTQLELGRFTMLVGDNASGKSSVLEALALLTRLGHEPASVLRDDLSPHDLMRRGGTGPLKIDSEGSLGDAQWRVMLRIYSLPKGSEPVNSPWSLELEAQRGLNSSAGSARYDSKKTGWNDAWNQASMALGSARIYRLRAGQIAAPAYSDEPGALIEADGTNTAVALAAMKLGDDEAFQRVEDSIRKLVPSVERVRLRPATVNRPVGNVVGTKLYFDFRGALGIPAHNASQGTLIALSLLALLHGSNRPNLILLDDFDHALHPRAQMELMRMIKQLLALDEFHDVQIVATTHSPYMLDELDASEAYAFALREDGTVASKRLSEHPEAESTRGVLRAGQLWSLNSEKDWVLRG